MSPRSARSTRSARTHGPAPKRRRGRPGAAPGSLAPQPDAAPSTIEVVTFGPAGVTESTAKDAAGARALVEAGRNTFIIVTGVDDHGLLVGFGEHFDLHRLALEDVAHTHQRPKFDEYADQDFVVLRVPDPDGRTTQQMCLFVAPGLVLCFLERPLAALDAIRERIRQKRPRLMEGGADYLAYAAIDLVVDLHFPVVEEYERRIDEQEDLIFAHPQRVDVAVIHELKRDLAAWHRMSWQTRDVIVRMLGEEIPTLSQTTRLHLRDCLDHARQVVDLTEAARERAAGLLDLYLSVMSNRMNEIMRVLTVIATIFMPLSFIAGVYGMNFDTTKSRWNMPELNWSWGYPFSLALMAATAAGLLYYFRRQGWFGGRSRANQGERAGPGTGSGPGGAGA
ncbi:MAG: magnesium/cobalt transporter CorA [bacterium]|nr:magnesium/cobalt transporter CorA [bacterium]